jgi:hypothetical protein
VPPAPNGRNLGERAAHGGVSTAYARHGDGFAYRCIAAVLIGAYILPGRSLQRMVR